MLLLGMLNLLMETVLVPCIEEVLDFFWNVMSLDATSYGMTYSLPIIFYKIVNFFSWSMVRKWFTKTSGAHEQKGITFSKKVEQRIEQVINFNKDGTMIV